MGAPWRCPFMTPGICESPKLAECVFPPKLSVIMLVVCVDDFKTAGLWASRPRALKRCQNGAPTPFRLLLGCNLEIGAQEVPSKGPVRTMTYNVVASLNNSC